jgi:hypothetical protein
METRLITVLFVYTIIVLYLYVILLLFKVSPAQCDSSSQKERSYMLTIESLFEKKPKAEQDWTYLLHHLHPPEKEKDMESVHHCPLFDKKDMEGNEFEQYHVKDGKVFQHAILVEEDPPDYVYDHLDNQFTVRAKNI